MLFPPLFLQERKWTGSSARPPRLQSPWPVRCLAQETVCSVIGRPGPAAPRPAPVRPSRGSRWGRAPSWPTTPGKVSSATFSMEMYADEARILTSSWPFKLSSAVTHWMSRFHTCLHVHLSLSHTVCLSVLVIISVGLSPRLTLAFYQFLTSFLCLCLFFLVYISVCVCSSFCSSFLLCFKTFSCILSRCVCVCVFLTVTAMVVAWITVMEGNSCDRILAVLNL